MCIRDRPTAALDPMAEAEVYSSFDKIVGNKTAIYISHRLSSCRFCDHIAVFDNGQIAVSYTHLPLWGEAEVVSVVFDGAYHTAGFKEAPQQAFFTFCPACQNVRFPEVSAFENIRAAIFRSCVILFNVIK